jgi:hypothetical protein
MMESNSCLGKKVQRYGFDSGTYDYLPATSADHEGVSIIGLLTHGTASESACNANTDKSFPITPHPDLAHSFSRVNNQHFDHLHLSPR